MSLGLNIAQWGTIWSYFFVHYEKVFKFLCVPEYKIESIIVIYNKNV